jgi:conjugative transfer region protein TrbK
MLDRPETFRIAAIIVLIAVLATALAAISRRSSTSIAEDAPAITSPTSDDLSTELRRCDAVSPTSAEEAHCEAVWKENRRRFFGKPARLLPPQPPKSSTAPATTSAGGAP